MKLPMHRFASAALVSLLASHALAQHEPTASKPGQQPDAAAQAADKIAAKLFQQGNAPDIEKFMKIRAPNSPTLAADGTLYVRDWPDGIQQLYKRAAGAAMNEPMTKLTSFKDGIAGYSLSHDSKHIIVSAATGGNEQNQIYHLDPATGEIKPLLENPAVVYNVQCWLQDSSGFVFTANDESSADFHIYRFDFEGSKVTKLLAQPGEWSAADITADGTRLLVGHFISASKSEAFELTTTTGALKPINIGSADSVNTPFAYLAGERAVLVLSDKEQGILRLFARDLASGTTAKPLPDLDPYPIEGGAINHERTLAAIDYNEGGFGSMKLVTLPDYKSVDLPKIEKGIAAAADIRGNTVVYTLSNARVPGVSYAFKVGGQSTPLTIADTQGIDLGAFPLPELVTYKSFDGVDIPAFLFTPPGYTKGTPIPFVVNYHGGPEGQSRPGFTALTQYLLASGYGVMLPNVRGSTGYGTAFQQMDDYKNRWSSVKDGVQAAQWLIDNKYSQVGKIAAYGGSYGGFMAVACIIEGNQIFGASVDVVGIVNFKTFLEQTKDYRRKLREVEYGPLTDPDFLASVSPITRVDEIKCPMFIAHGLNDPRVPVGEAMQLAEELKRRGFAPEQLYFNDEGHGFAKLENRLLFSTEMVRFLNRTIGSSSAAAP